SEGLGTSFDLGMTTCLDRLDGRAWQRVVGREEPAQRLDVVVTRVLQDGERAGQALHDIASVEEHGGHLWPAAAPAYAQELVVLEELLGAADRETHALGHFGEGEPLVDEGIGLPVDLCNRKRHETTTTTCRACSNNTIP